MGRDIVWVAELYIYGRIKIKKGFIPCGLLAQKSIAGIFFNDSYLLHPTVNFSAKSKEVLVQGYVPTFSN